MEADPREIEMHKWAGVMRIGGPKTVAKNFRQSLRDLPGFVSAISVLWSFVLGVVCYVFGKFPLWYFYQTGPSSDERGPFWDSGVVLSALTSGILGFGFFRLIHEKMEGQMDLL